MTEQQRAELDEILKHLDRDDVSAIMQGYLKMVRGMIYCVVNCLSLLDEYLDGKMSGERAEGLMRGQIACVTVID